MTSHKPSNSPQAEVVLGALSDEMGKTPTDQAIIRDLLDQLKINHGSVYERLKGDRNSLVHQVEEHLTSLREETQGIQVPPYILGNREILGSLKPYGTIENGYFIPKNEQVKKDFAEFQDLMLFINNVDKDDDQVIQDPKGLVDRYKKILHANISFIEGASLLKIMYAEALYKDLQGRGYFYKKDHITGAHEIVRPQVIGGNYVENDLATDLPGHPYLTLLGENEVNNVMLSMSLHSIITRDNFYHSLEVVGQATMIQRILAKNKILGPDGKNIQKGQLLQVDYETVRPQVETLRATALSNNNFQDYQELQYLIDFIDNRDALDPRGNLELFRQANVYRKGFLAEQAYLKATGNSLKNTSPEGAFDYIANLADENQGKGLLMALVAFFVDKRLGLAAFFTALFGGDIARVAGDVTDKGGEALGLWDTEKLEILDPQNIRYDINVANGINRSDITGTLDTLYKANEIARKNGGLEGSVITHTVSNATIAKVFGELLKQDTLLDESFSTSSDLASSIHNVIDTSISGDSFDSRTPNTETGSISQNDIKAVLALMGKTVKQEGDETIGDVLFEGQDPKNEAYVPIKFGFEGESARVFNTGLNTIFASARNDIRTQGTRKNISRLQSVKKSISATLGGENPMIDLDTNVGVRARSLFLLGESSEIREAIQKVVVIPDEDLSFNGRSYKAEIVAELERYQDYIEADIVLTEFDGFGAKLEEGTEAVLGKISEYRSKITGNAGSTDIERDKKLIIEIEQDLALLGTGGVINIENGTSTVDLNIGSENKPLLRRYNEIISGLEAQKTALEASINGAESATINRLNNALNGRAPVTLSPAERTKLITDFTRADGNTLNNIADNVIEQVQIIQQGKTKPVTELLPYINTYGAAYVTLSGMSDALSGITTPLNPVQGQILSTIQQSVADVDQIRINIEAEIEREFQKNKDLETKIDDIFVVASAGEYTVANMQRDVERITEVRSELEQNIVKKSVNFSGTTIDDSTAEIAKKKLESLFGTTVTIPNDTITAPYLYTELRTKSDALANHVKTLISTARLAQLIEMTEGNPSVLDFVSDEYDHLNLRAEVKRRVESLVLEKLAKSMSVTEITEFTEGTFKEARSVFEWSLTDQPNELLEKLEIDKELAKKLEATLKSEIAALPLTQAGLIQAKKLAESMSWDASRTSTLGRWRTIFGENFTEFTGLFDESGTIEGEFNKRVEEIRNEILQKTLVATPFPNLTYMYPSIEAAMNIYAINRGTPSLSGQVETDRDTMTLQNIYTKYKNDSNEIIEAFRREYLID